MSGRLSWLRRIRWWGWTLIGAAAVVLIIVGLVFQPWKLVVNSVVDEPFPVSQGAAAVPGPSTAAPGQSTGQSTGATGAASDAVAVASGTFISHEHPTSGTATIYRLSDGTRVLRLTDFRTSNGPMVQVWLSGQPVADGVSGWRVFDDGAQVNLGDLKGNVGDQNYVIPAEVDLAKVSSVAIWCARFHVSFGAAALKPA